jgi:hypothetical protein
MEQIMQPDAMATARAWQAASRIVLNWPELSLAWADWYQRPAHLVVQSDSGATLHFTGDGGPLLESAGVETELRWEDVEHLASDNPFSRIDVAQYWGEPTRPVRPTAKSAIYAAIAGLVSPAAGWTARPAKIVFGGEKPLDDPRAVFRLIGDFPSLMSTVQWYAAQVSAGLRRASVGAELAWHEPLWLVARNDRPIAVFDEAGRVHLARVSTSDDNLGDLLELVSDDADWVAGGFSFDILQALARLDGDIDALVGLVVPGARHAFGPRRSWSPADPNREQPPPRRLRPSADGV